MNKPILHIKCAEGRLSTCDRKISREQVTAALLKIRTARERRA